MPLKHRKALFLCSIAVCYFALQFSWPELPMRWPDEIIFYSSGRDLVENGVWHLPIFSYLHPSYDETNFILPPLYSILFYLSVKILPVKSSPFFPYFQIVLFLSALLLLYRWFDKYVKNSSVKKLVLLTLFMGSPLILYNTHIIRPESVICSLLTFLIYLLWRYNTGATLKKRIPYLILTSVILCVSAYLHYNAIVLIPVVLIFLFRQSKGFLIDILLVFVFSLIGMIPWFVMVISNYDGFTTHFLEQTNRMYVSGVKYVEGIKELVKINACGFLKDSIFMTLFAIYKYLLIILFVSLTLCHTIQKSISKLGLKLIISLFTTAIFCVFHYKEGWFKFYFEYMLLIVSAFLLLDLRGRTKSSAFLTASMLLTVYSFGVFALTVTTYGSEYYSSSDFKKAVECIVSELPDDASVVVSAIPDPSVAMLIKKPSLKISRMVDYPSYGDAWGKLVARESYFVTANFRYPNFDGKSGIKYDHMGALKDKLIEALKNGGLHTKACFVGQIPLFLQQVR